MTARILIVEDEDDIRAVISYALKMADFDVYEATSGSEAVATAQAVKPQLMVLDLMLPGFDGKEVCRRLKQEETFKDLAIIMLTARAGEIDRVAGFELGADDYLTKPFSPRELILRIKAILRRLAAAQVQTRVQAEDRLPASGTILTLDPGFVIKVDHHEVFIEGRPADLTATEFKLLLFMARRPGRVLGRELLLAEVWGYTWEGCLRTVDTHMRRLRVKLGPKAGCLETVRGVGYRFIKRPPS